ncbi:MAG: Lrp/AsnC family transcriptional regulator [Flavobacteriales bacterium]|jgi:Lrp/AsnC family transcriptional regulator, leucine-responsive regulatory protein|nr:Lrp/AsnC family transcriptional regulator [Flavobacteriales bacterium]
MALDKTDKLLLHYLQQDSKMATKVIAVKLDLSVTAIYERIKKLEKSGYIEKYVAVLDRDKIDRNFVVFCQIKLIRHSHDYIQRFELDVKDLEEVLECYNVSGEYDYILKVIVRNMKAYRNFINDKLTTLNYIGSTHSTFIITEVKQQNVVSLTP